MNGPMRITLLKSKLHRVRVTHAELDYEGSVAIDGDLMDSANIREFERLEIYNVNNGERFTTYAIRTTPGSGIISVMGAAAHKVAVDDLLIICTYADFSESEAKSFAPDLVYVDEKNRLKAKADHIPAQVA